MNRQEMIRKENPALPRLDLPTPEILLPEKLDDLSREQLLQSARQMTQLMLRMSQAMMDIQAEAYRMAGEINALGEQVRSLIRVTPAQARAIGGAIQERAAYLCQDYRIPGQEKALANAIRKAIRMTTGIQSMRELPRDQYQVALEQAQTWEDYKAIKAIKAKGGGKA